MNQQEVKNWTLSHIAEGKPEVLPLPEVPMYAYIGNPVDDFIKRLLDFDGRVIEFKKREAALDWLKKLPELDASVNRIYSSLPEFTGNVTEDDVADLRNAHTINVCVTEGEIGVGEMGAIWVTDASLKHAACALFARRLFILLDAKHIVGGLHQAYADLKIQEHQYGSFYTGPSATADIEAVHITGAQGPLVFTALIYNRENAPDEPALMTSPNADTSVWAKSMEDDV